LVLFKIPVCDRNEKTECLLLMLHKESFLSKHGGAAHGRLRRGFSSRSINDFFFSNLVRDRNFFLTCNVHCMSVQHCPLYVCTAQRRIPCNWCSWPWVWLYYPSGWGRDSNLTLFNATTVGIRTALWQTGPLWVTAWGKFLHDLLDHSAKSHYISPKLQCILNRNSQGK
jgi:hypothetical protein